MKEVPFTVALNCVCLSIVIVEGASEGVKVKLAYAFDPLTDCGVYPSCAAFLIAEFLS